MHKRLCACGCGNRVTLKVELQHINALAPGILASQVLDQNQRLVPWRKKKCKAIGFFTPVHQQLTMGNTTEIADMDIDLDDKDSVSLNFSESMMMGEDLDKAYGQSRLHHSGWIASHVEDSKSFQNISHISQVDQNIYVDHAGPLGLTHDNFLLPDPLHENVMDYDY
jgi:hypothetical protein